MSYDKQCSSCGGFCGRGGCKRENVSSWEQRQRMATPHDQLIAELLDSHIPKTEREHAAAREIKRLREALAKPEQKSACFKCGHAWHPDECVNTAPPARKPLTDTEIDALFNSQAWVSVVFFDAYGKPLERASSRDFAHAIELAHGIGGEA